MLEYQNLFKTKTKSLLEQATMFFKGLFQSDKRNIERICEHVENSNYDRIQHFISNSPWDAQAVMNKVAQETNSSFEKFPKVGLLLDESGHSKKGDQSVGVSWQYNGNKGKIENCQVGVYAALSAKDYYCLVDGRIYLPEDWTKDKARCLRAGIPEENIVFKTKPEIALDIVKSLRSQGIRFDWIDADGLYGNDSKFVNALDDMGELFVLEIHSDQQVYLEDPHIYIPAYSGRGPKPIKKKTNQHALEVRHYAKSTPSHYWKTVTIRDTTKGLLECEALVRQVWVWDKESHQARARLLVVKKTYTKNGFDLKYALTNATENQFTWGDLIRMQSQRYFIERAFQESKQELGLSDYQVRGWLAWQHHTALVMMALQFVLREKLLNKESTPLLSTRDVREILVHKLVTKKRTFKDILNQMFIRHGKRKKSKERKPKINLQI